MSTFIIGLPLHAISWGDKGWSVHGGRDACGKLERKFAFWKGGTVRKRLSQDLPHPLPNPSSACLRRVDELLCGSKEVAFFLLLDARAAAVRGSAHSICLKKINAT